MRTPTKLRLGFFAVAISIFTAGFNLLPEDLSGPYAIHLSIGFALLYFACLPILYWCWIIKAGAQKAWKMLIVFSLSTAVARYSFPTEIAAYLEFISWVRYPIIAILLFLEFYLMFHVVRSLWGARHLKGDPRVHAQQLKIFKSGEQPNEKEQKKSVLAITMAYEPASWYYAFPWFSRQHPKALANVALISAKLWHWLLLMLTLSGTAFISYWLLQEISELAAIIVSSLIMYGVILVTANYRLSKHYSLYCTDKNLIINSSILGFLVVPLDEVGNVREIAAQDWQADEMKEAAVLGRGTSPNIKLSFNKPQRYFTMAGQFMDELQEVYLRVDDVDAVVSKFAVKEHQQCTGKEKIVH
jgi:hypothetical protein